MNKKLIAYRLSGPDNDTTFFEKEPPLGVLCKECQSCFDFKYHPSSLGILASKKYDVSFTYDNRIIVSNKFKEFCSRNKIEGLNFYQLDDKSLYYFIPENIIKINAEKSGIGFYDKCSLCVNYESAVGISSLSFNTKDISRGIYRTDICFGSEKEKSPVVIVDIETVNLMKKEKFTGIIFESVFC